LDGRTRTEERLDEVVVIRVSRTLKRRILAIVDLEARHSPEICINSFGRRALQREVRRASRAR